MFNVCPGCGEYTDAKEVVAAPVRAVCPQCRHEQPFVSMPLFVVTGASGSGKTTIALELSRKPGDFMILDQDILWNDAFNSPENEYRVFRNTWLRMVKNIHQSGRSVVLFGSAIPKQYETCVERRYLSAIHYLALVCDPCELERRLKQRPQWRKSGTDENVKNMLDFNGWLRNNATTTNPPMTQVDTTAQTVPETTQAIRDWMSALSRLTVE